MNFKSYFKIIRPVNAAIVFLSVMLGAISMGDYNNFADKIIFASLAAVCFSSAGMVLNDYFDFEIDKINRPDRVLPSGEISLKGAIIYFVILNIIGLFLNSLLPNQTQIIGFSAAITIYFYNSNFKKKYLIGNIIVATMTGLTFIYGASLFGFNTILIIPFSFAFLIMFSREVLKTIEDVEGDKSQNANTVAIKLGKNKSIILVKILLIFLIILDILPFIYGWFNYKYFIIVNLTINSAALYSIIILNNNSDLKIISRASAFLKYSLFGGLIALWLR